jgi:nicotinate phosphoribosyltransferase
VKLSEQAIKVSNPGIQNVRRFFSHGAAVGDVIWDELHPVTDTWTMVDPADPTRRRDQPADAVQEDLLVPILRHGGLVYGRPPLADIRARTQAQLALFHGGVRRLDNPHQYPVGLEVGLHEQKMDLIRTARSRTQAEAP